MLLILASFIKDRFNRIDKKIILEDIENINVEINEDKEENEYFICKICLGIVNNPKICENCENIFCGKCIEYLMKNSNNCPCCRHYCNLTKISRFARSYLEKINVKCPFKCGLTTIYKSLDNHIQHCDKKPVFYSCNKCFKEIIVLENYYHVIADHIKQCYREKEFKLIDSIENIDSEKKSKIIQEIPSPDTISGAHFFLILNNLRENLNISSK